MIECRELDAEQNDLPSESFDAVVCRFGLMLIPDQAAVLSETRRVLRPAGRCAFAVWGEEADNPWATRLWGVLDELVDLPATPPGAPGMFALADRERLSSLVAGAGLSQTALEALDVEFTYESFEDYWETHSALAGGLARILPTLSQSDRDHLIGRVREEVAEFRRPDGSYRIAGRASCVAATR